MLGHNTSLNKFKKIKIISSIFSDHNGVKLEINHKKKTEKHTKTWRLNNMLLGGFSLEHTHVFLPSQTCIFTVLSYSLRVPMRRVTRGAMGSGGSSQANSLNLSPRSIFSDFAVSPLSSAGPFFSCNVSREPKQSPAYQGCPTCGPQATCSLGWL